MKLLYVQENRESTLKNVGISHCCCKYFDFGAAQNSYTKKAHFHTSFEFHFIINGHQTYEIGDSSLQLHSGDCILIPPMLLHRVSGCGENTTKAAVMFDYDRSLNRLSLTGAAGYSLLRANADIRSHIQFILAEAARGTFVSSLLLENRLFELIVFLFRRIGTEEQPNAAPASQVPPILMIAKQFIEDNIELAPTVTSLSHYCNISTKQLYRLFLQYEGLSVFQYIRDKRTERIKVLLQEQELSLKEISERLHFSSEYYFSHFFKTACGMSPGAFRNMF